MSATQEISFASCQTLDQALERVEYLQISAGSLEVEGNGLRGFVIFVRGAVSAAFVQQGGLQGPAAMQKMRSAAGLKFTFIPAGAVPTPVVVPPMPKLPGQKTAFAADPQALSGGWTWEMPAQADDNEYNWRAPASLRDLEETVPEMSLPAALFAEPLNPQPEPPAAGKMPAAPEVPGTGPHITKERPGTGPHITKEHPRTGPHDSDRAPAAPAQSGQMPAAPEGPGTGPHDSDRAPAAPAQSGQMPAAPEGPSTGAHVSERAPANRTTLSAATIVAPIAVVALTVALFTLPDAMRNTTIDQASVQFAAEQTQLIVEEQLHRCSPLAHH